MHYYCLVPPPLQFVVLLFYTRHYIVLCVYIYVYKWTSLHRTRQTPRPYSNWTTPAEYQWDIVFALLGNLSILVNIWFVFGIYICIHYAHILFYLLILLLFFEHHSFWFFSPRHARYNSEFRLLFVFTAVARGVIIAIILLLLLCISYKLK